MSKHLSNLIAEANAITNETQVRFGHLTAQQLNWKLTANQWSIGQCFTHLITVNESYFPVFEQILSGEKKNTLWNRLPWLPKIWGRMLMKAASPEAARKLKAPKIFEPTNSNIDGAIIPFFIERQGQVIKYMKATEDLAIDKIIISSPATNLINYSLLDAYKIIIAHERRHLLQATRVSGMNGFPKE